MAAWCRGDARCAVCPVWVLTTTRDEEDLRWWWSGVAVGVRLCVRWVVCKR